jgi:cell division protein FtsW (lipid II flippase)
MKDTNHQKYIESVLQQVHFKEAHPEIAREIQNHLEELRETYSGVFRDNGELQREIVKRMGDPQAIGLELNQIHRPLMDWALVAQVVLLTFFGFTVMAQLGFLTSHLFWTVIGLFVGTGCIILKPAVLQKWSLPGFLAVGTITLLSFFSATYADGQPYLSFAGLNIKIIDLSAALFTLFAPGVLVFSKSGRVQVVISYILLALPLWIFMKVGSIFPAMAYGISILAMLTVFSASGYPVFWITCLGALGLLLMPATEPFVSTISQESLRQSEKHTDFVISSIHSWSPVVSMLVGICLVLLCSRLFSISSAVKSSQGKMRTLGIAGFISLGALWSLVSNLGFAPMPVTGVNLPFVSYGGSMMVAQLAMVGIALGHYRRKNISDVGLRV